MLAKKNCYVYMFYCLRAHTYLEPLVRLLFCYWSSKLSPQEPSQKIQKDACIQRISKVIMMLMMIIIIIMKLSTHLKNRWADFLCEKLANHWQICVVFTVQSSNHQPLIAVVYYNLFHKTKSRACSSMSGSYSTFQILQKKFLAENKHIILLILGSNLFQGEISKDSPSK